MQSGYSQSFLCAFAPSRLCAFFFLASALGRIIEAAPPQVTFLLPSGAQIGQTVSITAGGSFSNWPVQIWSDRADVSVECAKDKGKLLVKIAPEVPPGIAWLRLYDAEGAANLRPLLIGSLPEVVEQEPNDEARKPQPLDGSTVVNGQLIKNGDVDGFSFSLGKGQTLVAAMDANRLLGSPMDAALQIVSPEGFVLAQSDDERGLDPLLVFTAPAAGKYVVRTFAFPATPNSSINFAGGDNFVYRLTLTTAAFLDAALPLALTAGQNTRLTLVGWNLPEELKSLELSPGEGAAQHGLADPRLCGTLTLPVTGRLCVAGEKPTEVELPAVLSGQLNQPKQQHEFTFRARKGQRLVFRSESRALGYAIDPVLTVVDAAGKQLGQNDDTGRENREAELTFNAAEEGQYRLIVRDLHRQGGPRYVYRVWAGEPQPDFALKPSAESFTLAAGKTLDITVSVDRQGGFNEEIEISATGLPEGVSAEPVKSGGKGDSAKSVKLKLMAADNVKAAGPIRILGRTAGDEPIQRTAAASLASPGATMEDVWLTVTSGK
jgi:hypothetical protein